MNQNREVMPEGLALTMAMNQRATERFVNLTPKEREKIIQESRGVQSKGEMQRIVDRLAGDSTIG